MMILLLVHLRIIIIWMILFKFVLITVDPLDCWVGSWVKNTAERAIKSILASIFSVHLTSLCDILHISDALFVGSYSNNRQKRAHFGLCAIPGYVQQRSLSPLFFHYQE